MLPRRTLIARHKAFVWLYLEYGDVLYDQAFNNSFKEKLESVQCNGCLALAGAIRDTSREKIYEELVLESVPDRRLCIKLFYQVFKILNIFSAWFSQDACFTRRNSYITSPFLTQIVIQNFFFHLP